MQTNSLPPATRPRVVVLAGLPGSGKSTWLERQGCPSLSSDHLRWLLADDPADQSLHERVFSTLRLMLRHRLELRRPVTFVDATNLTPRERRPYIKLAEWYGASVECVFFDTPLEVCLERNRGRARMVPEEAMRMLAGRIVRPTLDEGFSEVRTMTAAS